MAIGTDVQRIKGNITAALSAIAEKGVTVPDGSNSDALAGLIRAIQAGGGNQTLLGGKFTTGEFVLAEETTSEYVIATSSDDGMLDLLNDGENLHNANVYNSIALVVYKKATDEFKGSNYAKCVISSQTIPTSYGSGSGHIVATTYCDSYGSTRAVTGSNYGANVSFDKLSMKFSSNYKGTPDFTYCWIAWRLLK